MPETKRQQILKMIGKMGVLRPKDVRAVGISGEYLNKLHVEGVLERPGRGIYTLAGAEPTENRSLAEACTRVPNGVVCLLSALRFHDLTTQMPFEVWIAIAEKARRPRVDYPPLRVLRFAQSPLHFAVEENNVEGVTIKVYSPAKTVSDCFKYRSKIGLDVAIEALRDCWSKRTATMDELWEAAKVCRMTNVMRPYLEALA